MGILMFLYIIASFPSDQNGPEGKYNQANPTSYQPSNGNTPNQGHPGPSGQGSLGLKKPHQGIKRPVERGEEPEGRGECEQQKRPKM